MDRVYLDHNATTPPDPRVVEEMRSGLEEDWGNPSSIHWFGQRARGRLEEARARVAALMKADPDEVHFTSGGTEADNIAVMGTAIARKSKGNRIITSTIEHPAIRTTCRSLTAQGFDIIEIPVDDGGKVELDALKEAADDKTILITIMAANNETGVIQPIWEIGEIAKECGALFHTDAVQAAAKIDIDVEDWPVDMLSIAGHKFYGPKGAGALWIRKGVRIAPRNLGGGQEGGMRGGTENIPGILGLGKAAEIAAENMGEWNGRIEKLRDDFEGRIVAEIKDTEIHGDVKSRVPNTTNISFKNAEGEAVMIRLDLTGVAVSTGSACSTGSSGPSHVLMAMGLTERQCETSIRFSLGKDNDKKQIDAAVIAVKEAVEKIRAISGL